MRQDTFLLRESNGVRYYSCTALDRIPRLRHGFSTRARGGAAFDLGHSSRLPQEQVIANRQLFLSALCLSDSLLITMRQVHSNRVIIIEDSGGEWNQSEGDAIAASVAGVALAVQVADCLPVLIADPVKRAAAAVHSGWRGALSGVLSATISEMARAFGSKPADLVIAVGPGIRSCCFEVGAEVVELFEKAYPGVQAAEPLAEKPGKHLLDLCRILEVQLDIAGVPPENRHDLGACTRCRSGQFFSYRAEGAAAGRMMGIIGFAG